MFHFQSALLYIALACWPWHLTLSRPEPHRQHPWTQHTTPKSREPPEHSTHGAQTHGADPTSRQRPADKDHEGLEAGREQSRGWSSHKSINTLCHRAVCVYLCVCVTLEPIRSHSRAIHLNKVKLIKDVLYLSQHVSPSHTHTSSGCRRPNFCRM